MGTITSFGECYFTCVVTGSLVMAGAFPCMFVEHVPEIASCFPGQEKDYTFCFHIEGTGQQTSSV